MDKKAPNINTQSPIQNISILISVADDHLLYFDRVVQQLKKSGLIVNSEMKGIGVITGSLPIQKLDSLKSIQGIADIESDRPIDLGLPVNNK